MNMGDKTRSVTIRLTEEQYYYLEKSAEALEVTPSKFLRMVINASMVFSSGDRRDNEHSKTDLNNFIQQ